MSTGCLGEDGGGQVRGVQTWPGEVVMGCAGSSRSSEGSSRKGLAHRRCLPFDYPPIIAAAVGGDEGKGARLLPLPL